MKKLLITSLVVVLAAMANAATIKWSFTETAKDSNNPVNLGSFTAYLFTESAWTTAIAGTITADTFSSAVASSGLTTSTGGTAPNNWTKWTTGSTALSWTSEDAASGNYYVVISDGTKYSASAAIAATAAATPQDASTPATWTIAVGKAPLGSGDFTTYATPEPTSGILLLLGMAGLALKRKRA